MSRAFAVQRPALVTLVALFPFGLGLWYLGIVLWSGFIAGMEGLRQGGAGGLQAPEATFFIPLAVGLAVAVLGFRTSRGLRRGARWARFTVPFLALFAFPAGSPYDFVTAAVAAALLFALPGSRRFFRRSVPEAEIAPPKHAN